MTDEDFITHAMQDPENWVEQAMLMEAPSGDIAVVLYAPEKGQVVAHYLSRDDIKRWIQLLQQRVKKAKNWDEIFVGSRSNQGGVPL